MKRYLWVFMIVFLLGSAPVGADDDVQYWSLLSMKVVDTEKIDWTILTEHQLHNDAANYASWYVSQKVSYDVWKNLGLGTNYTYLESKSRSRAGDFSEFRYQHRFELEVIPRWTFGDGWALNNRNRMEFRWIENNGSHNPRYRQRWTLSRKLKDWGPLTGAYVESEFMYSFTNHTYDENRTVPLGLNWKINEKVALSTFWMIQTRKGGDDWSANQILGTLVSLKF